MKQYSSELISFVTCLIFDSWNGISKIDLETAAEDIDAWRSEGYEDLPEDLTPESYMNIWNDICEA